MYTISVFKTVSDESVQAIHACQIGRGKLPTKNYKRFSLLGTKLFFKQILSLFTDPLFSLYRSSIEQAHENKNRWGGLLTSSGKGVGLGKRKRLCTGLSGKRPTYPSPKTTFCSK